MGGGVIGIGMGDWEGGHGDGGGEVWGGGVPAVAGLDIGAVALGSSTPRPMTTLSASAGRLFAAGGDLVALLESGLLFTSVAVSGWRLVQCGILRNYSTYRGTPPPPPPPGNTASDAL